MDSGGSPGTTKFLYLERSEKGLGINLHVRGTSGILWIGTQDAKKYCVPWDVPHNENYSTQNTISFLMENVGGLSSLV